MKVILVPVNDRPESAIALDQAFTLAKKIQASVKGWHIKAHRDSNITLPDEINSFIGDKLTSEKRYDDAKTLFSQLANVNGFKYSKQPKSKAVALWHESTGYPAKLFSILGPVSDLIIVSRPIKKTQSLARFFMMSAVLNSSKPVIILPQKDNITNFKNICIAWNQSTQAALAVTAAIPLLKMAENVTIVSNGEEHRVGPKSSHLKKYLKSWGIKTKLKRSNDKNDTHALLNAYKETDADLMVMGGYSHNRLRQKIFGGVTQYMLEEADIPVFLLHT
jgi:nucleotide-binding universal stress UspA family protein